MKTTKQPYEAWPHPCDRQEVRALVLAALEKQLRDDKLRMSEYLVWRRESSVGLGAALLASLDDYLGEYPIAKQLRRRGRTNQRKRER